MIYRIYGYAYMVRVRLELRVRVIDRVSGNAKRGFGLSSGKQYVFLSRISCLQG